MSHAEPFATRGVETLISVDVETAGPAPATYSLLSIGACLVEEPDRGFYVELQPEHPAYVEEALAVSGLTLAELARTGTPPEEAMRSFATWLAEVVPAGHRPVLLAFNAPFDWMFLSDYFARHIGSNPFGHAALDVKAFALGRLGGSWADTSMSRLAPRFLGGRPLSHHALADARDQAELFRVLRAEPVLAAPSTER